MGVLLTLPLAIAGIIWLALVSDSTLIRRDWLFLPLVIVLIILLNRWSFFLIIDMGARGGGTYGNVNSNLESIVRWIAVFLFGPAVLWLILIMDTALLSIQFVRLGWAQQLDTRWNAMRAYLFGVAELTLLSLISLSAYRAWGGAYPIGGLSFHSFLLGAGVIGIQLALQILLLVTNYLGYSLWKMRQSLKPRQLLWIAQLAVLGIFVPAVSNLFAAPLAGIYVTHGLYLYLTFNLALLAIAWLVHRMSQAIEQSRSQTAQIEKLETLGRAILNAPPDDALLPDLLVEHVPPMFTYARLAVWLKPGEPLLKQPEGWGAQELDQIHFWLEKDPKALALLPEDSLPWLAESSAAKHSPILLSPILNTETSQLIGGIYLELGSFGRSYKRQSLNLMLPALQSLAAQVASALYRTVVYEKMLTHQKTQNELEFARRIQMGFLPASLPQADGWQLTASLDPAREMSGDFYDVIALPSRKLGILIADVADKGVGPALYMALSRTLIRTFAIQFESQPDKVFQFANERIFQDAGDSLFVTAFYGVLEPDTGRFSYVNAGHNPPLLFRAATPQTPEYLARTGTALGAMEDLTWKVKSTTLEPSDVLVLYTDGVTEAQNAENDLFGDERLLETLRAHLALTTDEIHASVLDAIHGFAGGAPQFDDITIVTIKRN